MPITPENVREFDVWTFYLVTVATEAARGQIPREALAFGIVVDGRHVTLKFQLTSLTEEGLEDMESIQGDMEIKTDLGVEVELEYEVVARRSYARSRIDDIRWIWAEHD